jgi:hypothetical protein
MEAKMNQNLNTFAEALVFVHGTRAESEAALHAAQKPPKPGAGFSARCEISWAT